MFQVYIGLIATYNITCEKIMECVIVCEFFCDCLNKSQCL